MLNTLLPISARPASLGQLARDVDRLFEMTGRMNPTLSEGARPAWPGLNAWQDGEGFVVEAEIPGFGIEDIEVDVSDDTIRIRGQREQRTPEDANVIRRERSVTSFERSLRLPTPVEHDGVEATLTNGVLQVRMPIAQSARPRRIQINAGTPAAFTGRSSTALPGNTEQAQSEHHPAS